MFKLQKGAKFPNPLITKDAYNLFHDLPTALLGDGGRAVRRHSAVYQSTSFDINDWDIFPGSTGKTASDMNPREWTAETIDPSARSVAHSTLEPLSPTEPASVQTTCEDADQSTFEKGCDWVKLNTKKRCFKSKDSCPHTCGKCPCQDNVFSRFIKVPGKVRKRGCDWVRKRPEKRCNSERIKSECKKSCKQDEDTCPEDNE